jgi:hypothetical protein
MSKKGIVYHIKVLLTTTRNVEQQNEQERLKTRTRDVGERGGNK